MLDINYTSFLIGAFTAILGLFCCRNDLGLPQNENRIRRYSNGTEI